MATVAEIHFSHRKAGEQPRLEKLRDLLTEPVTHDQAEALRVGHWANQCASMV
jgi:hypothetical protein